MAFSSAQPADNTKIRNLGLVLRNNFQAMEAGDISYKTSFLNIAEQGAPPAATADTGNVYGFQGALGQTELYYQDDAGNITQITNAGAINTFKLGFSDGVLPVAGSFYVIGMGQVTNTGAGVPSFSFSAGNIASVANGASTSLKVITFTAAVPNTNYIVLANPIVSGASQAVGCISFGKTTANFTVQTTSLSAGTIVGSPTTGFNFLVLGVN